MRSGYFADKCEMKRSKTDEFVQSTNEEGICERFMTRCLHYVIFEHNRFGITLGM